MRISKAEAGKLAQILVEYHKQIDVMSSMLAAALAQPAAEEIVAAARRRGAQIRKKLRAAEGGSLSAKEAAREIGLTEKDLLKRYREGLILGWRYRSEVRFPAWQFKDGKVLEGIEKVLSRLADGGILDDWGKIGFFLQQHRLSESRRPLDLLRENNVDEVLRIAEAYGD